MPRSSYLAPETAQELTFPWAREGGLSSTTIGISISKSLGTFWIFGSVKVIRPEKEDKAELSKGPKGVSLT